MNAKILDIKGSEKGSVKLPKEFSAKIREDIVAKVLEATKKIQPYAPSPVAGKQHSASGVLIHQRHVWKSQYGKGMSRVPRKIFSRRGSQFNWEGAMSPNTRGGRRAHPPKIEHFLKELKVNKKEVQIAFESALSATISEKHLIGKYSSLEKLDNKGPFIISSVEGVKTKDLLSGLNKILGERLFNVATKKKTIRAGKGKLRGRKYKSNAGMLLVIGNEEKFKTKRIDVVKAKDLQVSDLAKGGLGRLTVYTEKAIKNLGEKNETVIN
jgi:large subunit ribosomal protein L4e